MATNKRRPKSSLEIESVLDLLDPSERADLAGVLDLDSLDEPDLPLTVGEVIDHVIALRLPFIQMMGDISALLGQLDAAVRGNIRFVVLPESGQSLALDFGSQVRQAIATALNRQALQDHEQEITTRLQNLDREVVSLCDRARPMPVKRYTSMGTTLRGIGSQLPSGHPERRRLEYMSDAAFSRRRVEYHPLDRKALDTVHSDLTRLQALIDRVSGMLSDDAQPAGGLTNAVSRLSGLLLKKVRSHPISQMYPHPRRCTDEGQVVLISRRVSALEEAILAAADYVESLDEIYDFLNLEIWKQRWRVYELWILARVVAVLQDLGGSLEGTDRIVDGSWTLKFTKDSEPALSLRLDDQLLDVYYQYYQAGDHGGDMPDIAVKVRGLRFVAVFDPKHGKSYSRRDLNEVCLRYAQSFDPYLSCVMNYFDVRDSEALASPRRSIVLYGLRPGTDILTQFAEETAGAVSRAWEDQGLRLNPGPSVIVLFDGSSSTEAVRASLLSKMNEFLDAESRPARAGSMALVYGERVLRKGSLEDLRSGRLLQQLPSSATNLSNAVEEALAQLVSKPSPRQLWIVTDGDCGDSSALERLLSTVDAQVTILESTKGGADTALAQLSNRIGARYLTP